MTWETRYEEIMKLALELQERRLYKYPADTERDLLRLIDQALEAIDKLIEYGMDPQNPNHIFQSGRLAHMLEHIVWIVNERNKPFA